MTDQQNELNVEQLLKDFWTDPSARERLLELVHPGIVRIAKGLLKGNVKGRLDLETGDLVDSAFKRLLAGTTTSLNSLGHLRALLATAVRNALVDKYRRLNAQRRGAGLQRKPLEGIEAQKGSLLSEVLQVHEYLEDIFPRNPLRAKVLELYYFLGKPTFAEIADTLTETKAVRDDHGAPLRITSKEVEKEWRLARLELKRISKS